MSVVDLVASCTTGSCQKSISFSKVVRLSTENLTSCVFLKRKKWRVQFDFGNVILSIPKPTRCKLFKSKSDVYWNFSFKIWRVKKIEFEIWHFLKFSSANSDFYLLFQVLTEGWYFLSTLITTYFKGENWTTMSVIDLDARCTTGSCHPSIRLSMVV